MPAKTALKFLFTLILLGMIGVTGWASTQQPILAYHGLYGPDRAWTIATLCDAYAGFLTFYAWVYYKEAGTTARLLWLIAILLLGNMAMSAYVLRELWRLAPDEPLERLLLRGGR